MNDRSRPGPPLWRSRSLDLAGEDLGFTHTVGVGHALVA